MGIDPGSSRLAYSVFSPDAGELLFYSSVECKTEPKNRPYELAEALYQDLQDHGIGIDAPVFYIEQPFGFNVSGIAAVERTIGGLLYLLHPSSELINVNTWKKACQVEATPRKKRSDSFPERLSQAMTDMGQPQPEKITSKTQIKKRCLELFPQVPEDVRPIDVFDSVLIGYAGYLINAKEYVE